VTIKSHHNVGGLPEGMKLKLVEPLRGSSSRRKVRALGKELGPSPTLVKRHPFPRRPASAIRIPARSPATRSRSCARPDAIYLEEIRNAGLYDAIWQAFAVLLAGEDRRRHGRLTVPTTMSARCAPSPRPTA